MHTSCAEFVYEAYLKHCRTKEDKEERSRPIIQPGEEFSASESDFREEDCPTSQSHAENEFSCKNSSDLKLDVDTEAVSCYCSASHTDNISTDEHDSIRDSHSTRAHHHRGLQSSDSGADLTEHIRNDPDAAWHKFWANHGERLIWDSWIAKYSDYINPEYLVPEKIDVNEALSLDADAKEDLPPRTSDAPKARFSFDKKDADKSDQNLSIIEEDRVLVEKADAKSQLRTRTNARNLSNSDSVDKLNNTDISDGWNPLSPLSIDCETEAERLLLSSRCGSYASGSLRTVDSMTNVTRMTVSSIDLSESSKNSGSFSSVSSVQSSLSSTSSEEFDDNLECNSQWNHLWKKHYEEEYLRQYKKFMSFQSSIGSKVELSLGVADIKDDIKESSVHLNHQVLQSLNRNFKEQQNRKSSNNSSFEEASDFISSHKKRKEKGKKIVDSVSSILENIKMDDAPSTSGENNTMECTEESNEDIMKNLGLPTSFSRKRANKRQFPKSLGGFDSNAQSLSDRVKSAFNLLEIEMKEGNGPKLMGKVDYKMKHIRLQNRHLRLLTIPERATHKYFDDDGNEVEKIVDEPEFFIDNEDLKSTSSSEVLVSPVNFSDEEMAPIPGDKKKRRRRGGRKKPAVPVEIKENPKLYKFWKRRFSLFSKFNMGIKLDEESWYSVTPETVAKHIAERCKCDVIIDAFCGAGGNAIQFAKTCKRVIAIDIDEKKIDLARNNAEVYGVHNRIEFIVGDFFTLCTRLKADVVFLSPPWGGMAYLSNQIYDLEDMLKPLPLSELLENTRRISHNIALFLPKNSNTYALVQQAGPGGFVELEQNFLNKNLIAITAFYNDLIRRTGTNTE